MFSFYYIKKKGLLINNVALQKNIFYAFSINSAGITYSQKGLTFFFIPKDDFLERFLSPLPLLGEPFLKPSSDIHSS